VRVWLRDKHGKPWQFTPEQARFVLWYFAIDESGVPVPLGGAAAAQGLGQGPARGLPVGAAMFAEVTFDHWDGDVPVGASRTRGWIQIVAVSQEQTQNTMKLFPSLISPRPASTTASRSAS
jgi:hypothetical protein